MLHFRGCYFEEGGVVKMNMSIESAYEKSVETLLNWINKEIDTNKTQVMFRGYSPVHLRFVFIFSWCKSKRVVLVQMGRIE